MKALLISDILVIKAQAKSVLIVLALWLAISAYNGSGVFFSALSVVYAMMLPITCIAAFEKSHFERYALAMPLTRTGMALGHYVFALLCSLALAALGFVACVAMGGGIMESLVTCAACFSVAVVMVSVLLPVVYKFGTEKARLTMVAIFVVFLLFFGGALKLLDIELESLTDIFVLLPFLAAIILCVSAAISVHIVKKREF